MDLNGNGLWDGCELGEPDGCWGPFGGEETDIPVAGDWTGDGFAKIGIYRQGSWYLDLNGNTLWDGCGVDACLGPFGGIPKIFRWWEIGTGRGFPGPVFTGKEPGIWIWTAAGLGAAAPRVIRMPV